MDCLELKLPLASKYLGVAVEFVKGCAKNFGFQEPLALCDIEVAAEEAISNAIDHACPTQSDPSATVLCLKAPTGMQIVVRDNGIPFDPEKFAHYKPTDAQSQEDMRGLGMFLMRAVMDEVTFRNLGREGKELVLLKRFKHEAPEAFAVQADAGEAGLRSLLRKRKRCGYQLRMFEPSDAVEVCRCAYLMHGYSFYDDEVYYPQTLVELYESGAMTAAVAVTPEGEVALFNALIRSEPSSHVAEMTFTLVNPTIRSPGGLEKVAAFLVDGQRHWLKGVFSSVAASHTLTQNVMQKNGFMPCGIYLCVDAANWKFHFLRDEEQANEPISNVCYFLYLNPPTQELLYLPPRHRDMIETIYGWLGAKPRNVQSSNIVLDTHAQLESHIIEADKTARITVMAYGLDLVSHVSSFMHEGRRRDIRFLELRLPLNLPGADIQTEALERLGFFFSGILPMGKYGDYLLLQMPSEWDINYDAIKVASQKSRLLFDYIRQCEKDRHETV
ncbi:MAG: ATP-binding protein [Syntrophobacteraceae bacterium]